MRITCPICGERDRREFYYQGAALARPEADAAPEAWDDYVHNRENPCGVTEDLWFHESGCGAWVVVKRNTATHEVVSTRLASNGMEAGS